MAVLFPALFLYVGKLLGNVRDTKTKTTPRILRIRINGGYIHHMKRTLQIFWFDLEIRRCHGRGEKKEWTFGCGTIGGDLEVAASSPEIAAQRAPDDRKTSKQSQEINMGVPKWFPMISKQNHFFVIFHHFWRPCWTFAARTSGVNLQLQTWKQDRILPQNMLQKNKFLDH